ncbi:hypothetical protein BJ878DRAFT_555838 [Calycina marina]|uniref:Retroviral polymerase SH3-like domain-containing protein n=1 Tax=Calycina marina TaxID=1763456 RepID=A0A9P8CD65_9HELO|nr:hypothetical protein BJ878DRAFT_555838 [Calycina marina]
MEMANSMRVEPGLREGFWEYACDATTYLKNREPLSAKYHRIIGCPADAHIPDEKRKKSAPKAWKGTLVGQRNDTTTTYKIWNALTETLHEARFVIFYEIHSRKTYREIAEANKEEFEEILKLEGCKKGGARNEFADESSDDEDDPQPQTRSSEDRIIVDENKDREREGRADHQTERGDEAQGKDAASDQ